MKVIPSNLTWRALKAGQAETSKIKAGEATSVLEDLKGMLASEKNEVMKVKHEADLLQSWTHSKLSWGVLKAGMKRLKQMPTLLNSKPTRKYQNWRSQG